MKQRAIRSAMILFAASALAMANAASAQANSTDDFWLLDVDPGPCAAPFDKDPAFCGPRLVVRTVWTTARTVTVRFSLTGPDGAVPLQKPTTFSSSGWRLTPPTVQGWGGSYAGTRTPTDLPAGQYSLVMDYSADGKWDCSLSYRDVCNWDGGTSGSERYNFTWSGEAAQSFPEQRVEDFTVSPSKTRKGKKTLVLDARLSNSVYIGDKAVVSFEKLVEGTWVPLATANASFGSSAKSYVTVAAQRQPLTIRATSPSAPNNPGKAVTLKNMS